MKRKTDTSGNMGRLRSMDPGKYAKRSPTLGAARFLACSLPRSSIPRARRNAGAPSTQKFAKLSGASRISLLNFYEPGDTRIGGVTVSRGGVLVEL